MEQRGLGPRLQGGHGLPSDERANLNNIDELMPLEVFLDSKA
jgi:hypothetical protein